MNVGSREWLRGFLKLGARAEKEGIPVTDVARQEDTVLRALKMFEVRPGIVLADEVGMGKTYEALGVAAAMRHVKPRSRIVIVTPGPDLNAKWFSELSRFREMYDFGDNAVAVRDLADFIMLVRKHPVVVAPVTMFQSGRGSQAQAYLLSLFFYWKKLHGHTANAIMARFRDGTYARGNVASERFLGVFDLEKVEPYLRAAFRRGRSSGAAGLDDLYEEGGYAAFKNDSSVRNALYRARFVLTGKLMPMIDLLIVDEAHKLKNPGSLRTRAMRGAFDGRFRKALFLTATPFQLDVGELREVFSLFAGAKDAPKDLEDQVEALLSAVGEYQRNYETFQQSWLTMDPGVAARFCDLYDNHPERLESIEEPILKVLAHQIQVLRDLKNETIEPGFRHWMIRSLREDKRIYRAHVSKSIRAAGASALPFLIYERFIAELFRRGRQTHKAAVEINMVSSYAAARRGAILSDEDGIPAEAEVYRDLLRDILGEIESGNQKHPKISDTINDSLDAADRGEKTLIFCSRIATLEHLRRELDAVWEARILERWRQVYPGVGAIDIFDSHEDEDKRQRGRHSLLQSRFHRSQDALYLALREPYIRTLTPLAEWAREHLAGIVGEAEAILQQVRVGKTSAERTDYQVAKRCVEQATIRHWQRSGYSADIELDMMVDMLNDDFVRLGLDLEQDEFEVDSSGDEQPSWHISERLAAMVLGEGGSLWEILAENLAGLTRPLRVRVVEQLARYLTYKQVTFIADLLLEAKRSGVTTDPVESAGIVTFMPRFWKTDLGKGWIEQIRAFLTYFLHRDPRQQMEILDGPIKTGDFARHTRDGESRDRLREAFNTPLHPMILIANEVMQEGLDLHKQCRRVVHHDLVWNPAQIEQRIGRIDRLGSLTNHLRMNGADVTLDVLYPIIRGTIDERLFHTVKTREKWLEFLLGAAPNFSEYCFTDVEPPPLPERLGIDLSIDLGPQKRKA